MFKLSKSIFIQFALITILSIAVFYPSFNLALFGDDWLAFWRYIHHLGPGSSREWNHLTYYLTPYGAQDIIMGLLYKVYGFNSTLYYLTSYILRLIASFSLYPLVFYLTKNKLSAFFATLFFSVTVVGLDATNWVFNMPSYITISFFFLSLYFFISSREQNSKSGLIISAVLYYFAYITTPIRMHGSLPFLFLIESFWILQNRNSKTLKAALIRFGLMFIVFLIVRLAGHSQGPPNEASERFMLGITTSLTLLGQGRFDFIFHPLIIIGSMIYPDLLLRGSQVISFKQFLATVFLTFFISISIVSFLLKFINNLKLKKIIILTSSFAFWTLVASLVHRGNLTSFNNSILINLLLIGGYVVILAIILSIYYYRQKNTANLLFLSLCWILFSFFFAWWWVPTSIFPTTYRYLIVSAVGVSMLLATIISLGKGRKQQIFLFTIFSLILILHIISTRIYINYSLNSHGQEVSNKIWSSIPHVDKIGKSRESIIFYFEGDNTNAGILHDVITFGFPPHMAILYNLREEDGGFPVPMSDFKEVVSAVVDGKPMPAYGYPVKPVPIERIYAFHLKGKDELINVTGLVRENLSKIKSQTVIK